VEREFWQLIAQGKRSEDAAVEVGVSAPVGTRWFRHAGGMPPLSLVEPTGRYLSFKEREELALLRAQGLGVRAIARELRRHPSTRENCGATRRPAAASPTTAHRSRNGKRRPRLDGRSRRSLSRTRG
jgi:hypothetical protein